MIVCWRTGLWIPGSHWRAPEDDRRGGNVRPRMTKESEVESEDDRGGEACLKMTEGERCV